MRVQFECTSSAHTMPRSPSETATLTRIARQFASVATFLALLAAPAAVAQPGGSTGSVPCGSAVADPTVSLGFSLHDAVLAALRPYERSRFVQAFLLATVREHADADAARRHPLACRTLAFYDSVWTQQGGIPRPWHEAPATGEILQRLRDERADVAAARRDSAVTSTVGDLLARALSPDPPEEQALVFLSRMDSYRDARLLTTRLETREGRRLSGALGRVIGLDTTIQNALRELEERRALCSAVQAPPPEQPAGSLTANAAHERARCLQEAADRFRGAFEPVNGALDTLRADYRMLANPDAATKPRVFLATAALGGASRTEQQAILDVGGSVVALQQAARAPRPAAADPLLALTDLLIERATDEVVLAYVETIGEQIRQYHIEDAFPATVRLTRMVEGRTNSVSLAMWRAALVQDLRHLPVAALTQDALLCRILTDAVPGTVACTNPSPDSSLGRARRWLAAVRPAVYATEAIVQRRPASDVLRAVATAVEAVPEGAGYPDASVQAAVANAARWTAAFAEDYERQSLDVGALGLPAFVVRRDGFVQATADHRDAYLRLVAAAVAREAPRTMDALRIRLGDRATDLVACLERPVASALGLLDRVVVTPDSTSDGRAFVQARLDGLVGVLDLAERFAGAQPCAPLAFPAGSLASGTAGTVTSAPTSIESLRTRWRAVAGLYDAMHAGRFTEALQQTIGMLGDATGGQTQLPAGFVRLASLGTVLADVRTGDDMRRAFREAALPPGGWRAKRRAESTGEARTRGWLNAYVGVGGGYEVVTTVEADTASAHGVAIGASLSIGPEWTLRRGASRGRERRLVHSVGVFVPILDLGALLSYRVSGGGGASAEPNTTVRQVFAPGIYVVLGLHESPFALSVGGQLMPALRRVRVDNEPDATRVGNAFRLGASVGVDLALFGF